jgi:hypothetical protein
MSNSFFKIILVINFITNTNYASISSRPIKEHNRSSNSYKNKLCRSFVNSALKLRQLAIKYCPGSDKNSD